MTPQELNDILVEYDEYTLIDKLSITSLDIVERFDDKIEDKFSELVEEETGEA